MSKWLHMAMKVRAPSATAKLILLCLADLADRYGRASPGQKALGDISQLSERTVRRALIDLEAAGLIKRERRHCMCCCGGREYDVITLQLPCPGQRQAERTQGLCCSSSQGAPSLHRHNKLRMGNDGLGYRLKLQDAALRLDWPSPTEKLVLIALASFVDANGLAAPRIEDLSNLTGYSDRAVQKALSSLREAGVITVPQPSQGGRSRPNVFRICLTSWRAS